jgi:NAD(P)-dependent dehydrogenase (short-subunit alcohol dehydrogenase family)
VAGVTYTASKHAVVGLTKNTAFMYALENIRCNAICPGGIATVAVFLASDDASFANGQCIAVDGG